jgi:hypothetical protein
VVDHSTRQAKVEGLIPASGSLGENDENIDDFKIVLSFAQTQLIAD